MKLLDNPKIRADFANALAESECVTPWHADDTDPGCIVDARGEEVARVDCLDPPIAQRVAMLVCVAVNKCAAETAEAV